MSKEAMKLALEALENWREFDPENFGEVDENAITAIKEALAKPEQMPVDAAYALADKVRTVLDKQSCPGLYMNLAWETVTKNYNTPPAAQPAPQRTWVGLTKWEREAIAVECGAMSADWLLCMEAVERALKEKNQ